jgi:hypothetical protein
MQMMVAFIPLDGGDHYHLPRLYGGNQNGDIRLTAVNPESVRLGENYA